MRRRDLWRLSPVFWWTVSVGSLQPRILVAEGRQDRYRPGIHSNHPGLDEFCVFRERLPLRSSRGPDQSTTSGRGRGGSSHWRRSCVNFCPNGLADRIRCRFVGPADRSHSRTAFGCRRRCVPASVTGRGVCDLQYWGRDRDPDRRDRRRRIVGCRRSCRYLQRRGVARDCRRARAVPPASAKTRRRSLLNRRTVQPVTRKRLDGPRGRSRHGSGSCTFLPSMRSQERPGRAPTRILPVSGTDARG